MNKPDHCYNDPLKFIEECTEEDWNLINDYLESNEGDFEHKLDIKTNPNAENLQKFFVCFKKMMAFRKNLIIAQEKELAEMQTKINGEILNPTENKKLSLREKNKKRNQQHFRRNYIDHLCDWNNEDAFVRMVKCMPPNPTKDQLDAFGIHAKERQDRFMDAFDEKDLDINGEIEIKQEKDGMNAAKKIDNYHKMRLKQDRHNNWYEEEKHIEGSKRMLCGSHEHEHVHGVKDIMSV